MLQAVDMFFASIVSKISDAAKENKARASEDVSNSVKEVSVGFAARAALLILICI